MNDQSVWGYVISGLARAMDHPRELREIETTLNGKAIGKRRVWWHRMSVEIDGVPLDGDHRVVVEASIPGDYPGCTFDAKTGMVTFHLGSPMSARITKVEANDDQ